MVLESSLPLYATFFDTHPELEPTEGWPERDFFMFREEDIKWFEERGCKWKKVEASPGDLILWDSRCVHYGAAAKGETPRVATCEHHSFYRSHTNLTLILTRNDRCVL